MNIKLYTKENCQPCQRVKDYLAGRPDLNVEVILYTGQPEILAEVKKYSQTFPTLVTDWGYVTNSEHILNYLASVKEEQTTIQVDNIENREIVLSDKKILMGFIPNIDNKIYRMPEPECEACQ